MSESAGALVNGPESQAVVRALTAAGRGDLPTARAELVETATTIGWDRVQHRLDVAGRALAADVDDLPGVVEGLPGWAHEIAFPPSVVEALRSWAGPVVDAVIIDLIDDVIEFDTPESRAWASFGALAWLVEVEGFPPEVVV